MTDEVCESLQAKHPDAADADARFLLKSIEMSGMLKQSFSKKSVPKPSKLLLIGWTDKN